MDPYNSQNRNQGFVTQTFASVVSYILVLSTAFAAAGSQLAGTWFMTNAVSASYNFCSNKIFAYF